DPIAAGNVVVRPDLCRDRLENRLDDRPGVLAPPRHQAWALERTLFAAGDAAADKEQSLGFDILRAALVVGNKRVSAVDNNVSVFHHRQQLLDQRIDRRAGLTHHHPFARPADTFNQFFKRMATDKLLSGGAPLDEIVDDAGRAIKDRDTKAAALD